MKEQRRVLASKAEPGAGVGASGAGPAKVWALSRCGVG